MKTIHVCFPLALLASPAHLEASDWTGVYALIEKAERVGSDGAAPHIILHGAFALADPKNRRGYLEPRWGIMYFTLAGDEDDKKRLTEWKDLQEVAGTGQVVGFGQRHKPHGTVRSASAKLEKPDIYPLGWGMRKLRSHRSRSVVGKFALMPKPQAPSSRTPLRASRVTFSIKNASDDKNLTYTFRVVLADKSILTSPPIAPGAGGVTHWAPQIDFASGRYAWSVQATGKDIQGPAVESSFQVADA